MSWRGTATSSPQAGPSGARADGPPRAGSSGRRGLVAVGDSITRGSGDSMLGLRMQSWALWLAEALGLPYTGLARDGATARDALAAQVPRLHGPYDLGCLYLGVNDVRAPGFELEPYASALAAVTAALAGCCERLLLVSLPGAIGVPPAPAWAIASANETIAALAREHGAALVRLETLTGRELLQPDAVHLTARGEAWIAALACRALGAEPDDELSRALEPLSATSRARWLALGRTPALVRDLRRRALEGAGARIGNGR